MSSSFFEHTCDGTIIFNHAKRVVAGLSASKTPTLDVRDLHSLHELCHILSRGYTTVCHALTYSRLSFCHGPFTERTPPHKWLASLPLTSYATLSLTPPKYALLTLLLSPRWLYVVIPTGTQRRGWEPDATLNWLALARMGCTYVIRPG